MLKTLSARLLTVIVGWTLRGGSAAGGSIAAPDAGGFCYAFGLRFDLEVWFYPIRLRLRLSKV